MLGIGIDRSQPTSPSSQWRLPHGPSPSIESKISNIFENCLESFCSSSGEFTNKTKITHFSKMLKKSLITNHAAPAKVLESLQHVFLLYKQNSFGNRDCYEWKLFEDDLKTKTLFELKSKFSHLPEDDPLNSLTGLGRYILKLFQEGAFDHCIDVEKQYLCQKITSSQIDWTAVKRDEMLRLLIAFGTHSKPFDCFVVDYRELLPCLKLLLHKTSSGIYRRVHFLVRNDVHYTALDVEIEKGQLRGCILDASQDSKYKLIEEILHMLNAETYVIGGRKRQNFLEEEMSPVEDKIQYDTRSCSIFALDHLQLTAQDDLWFKKLKEACQHTWHPPGSSNLVPWLILPFNFIRNAQCPKLLEYYLALHGGDFQIAKAISQLIDPMETNPLLKNRGIKLKLREYQSLLDHIFKSFSTELCAKTACEHPYESIGS